MPVVPWSIARITRRTLSSPRYRAAHVAAQADQEDRACPTSRLTSPERSGRSSVEVGQEVDEGDTVVILESMKMEMPVEAEDDGDGQGDRLRGGPVGLRGRHARRPRVSWSSPRASCCWTSRARTSPGSRSPTPSGAARSTTSSSTRSPRRAAHARRPLPGDPRHRRRCSPPATTSATSTRAEFEEAAERLVAHPFHDGDRGARRLPVPGRRPAQRPRDRRRAGAGARLRPPDRGRAASRSAMPPGQARADLLAHRAAPLHRRLRRGAARPSCSTSGRNVDADARRAMGLVNEVVEPGRARRARAGRSPPRSPPTRRCRWRATSA